MPASSEDVLSVLRSFSTNAVAARKKLAELYRQNTARFYYLCLPALRGNVESPEGQFIVAFLLGNNLLERAILDRHLVTPEQAGAILRVAKRIDPGFESQLIRMLTDTSQNSYTLTRLLEIVALGSKSNRLIPFLSQMMRHPDPFIQSKAALLMGKLNHNVDWVRQRLEDAGPRVQANAVESLWGETSEDTLKLFRDASENPDHRVAGNALIGMYLAGDPDSLTKIVDMAGHPSALFQATAIWAMGFTGDSRFLPFLANAMGKCGKPLRSRIFDSIQKIRNRGEQIGSFGSLSVYVASALRFPDGRRKVRFSIFDRSRNEILGTERFRPTHLIVCEGDVPQLQYSVQPGHVPSPVAIHLTTPGIDANPMSLREAIRPEDQWDHSFYRVPQSPEDWNLPLHNNSAEGLANALNTLSSNLGSRHAIFVGDTGSPLHLADVPKIVARAQEDEIVIHTVLPEDAQSLLQMESLSRETGGYALRYSDPGTYARHIELMVTSLLGPFELTYAMTDSDEKRFPEVRLQVFSPRGCGDTGLIRPVDTDSCTPTEAAEQTVTV